MAEIINIKMIKTFSLELKEVFLNNLDKNKIIFKFYNLHIKSEFIDLKQ